MRGFYRSFAVNYSMNVPFGSMLVLLNEKVKHLLDIRESSNSSYWWYYLIGGLSGGVASIPTCPFDVLKTKLNTQTCLNHQCEKKTFCMELARY